MTFSYTGIRVRDMEESLAFYRDVLGMRVQFRMRLRTTGGEVALLRSPRGRQRLELNWYAPGSRFATRYAAGEGLDHLAFRVGDLRRTIAGLRKRRIKIVEGPIGSGREAWAYIEDPNGIWIELVGSLRGARAQPRGPAGG